MIRIVIGVVVASVVLFFWGFLYWGLGPYSKVIWKRLADKDGATAAVREHFPENGLYFVPDHNEAPETLEERFRAGPVAMVYVLDADGRPMTDPSIMVNGFLLNVVTIALTAVILSLAGPAVPTYMSRVTLAAVIGFTAALMSDIGNAVWWQHPWSWQLYNAVYTFTAWGITALVLAAFMPKPSGAAK